ncbi:coiled-coil domain-containing protein 107 [Mantella aurantiaca]
MVLSSSQHILLVVSLALCMCFLVPRMIGGGGGEVGKNDPRRAAPPFRGHPHKESHKPGSQRGFTKADHIRSAMEQELKSEKAGEVRSMAFTLMPLYAVGVAIFAAYKFTKIKSKESSRSKLVAEDDKKSKETESQLLELERHLLQTEQMLNSILTQLDPLSTCVNTLAAEQKNEIMSQLQSIRHLMKKSGMDKSTPNPANQTCENTLEDLIHSLETQQSKEYDEENQNEESLPDMKDSDITAHTPVTEESSVSGDLCEGEGDAQSDGADATNPVTEGLRKRNV